MSLISSKRKLTHFNIHECRKREKKKNKIYGEDCCKNPKSTCSFQAEPKLRTRTLLSLTTTTREKNAHTTFYCIFYYRICGSWTVCYLLVSTGSETCSVCICITAQQKKPTKKRKREKKNTRRKTINCLKKRHVTSVLSIFEFNIHILNRLVWLFFVDALNKLSALHTHTGRSNRQQQQR